MRKLEIRAINPDEYLGKLYKGQRDVKKKERLLAIYKMQTKRWSALQCARELRRDPKTITNWVHAYNEGGIQKLLDVKKSKGRKSKISDKELEEILREIDKGKQLWTLKKIQLLLRGKGTDVSHQAIWYRLTQSGYSWKTGRRRHTKVSLQEQEGFKKGV